MTGGGGKEIYSTHDAAKICRVTPMTVIRWIKDGKIPAFKTAGGHRRILRADLERFCQARGIPFWPEGETAERRVLVVDAESQIREVVADAARSVDDKLTIETAGDAFTAGQLLASFRPNLIFLDQRLSGIDSLDLCSRLARDPETAPLSVVIMSASPSTDAERSYRARGALGLIAKPPVHQVVERMVRVAFRIPEAGNGARTAPMIHIVDRDVRAARILRRDLEGKIPGARVVQFESPIDALFAVTLERPDMMVLDVGALEVEPDDLVRRVLARLADHHVPIVALAPPHKESLRNAMLGAGARGFLLKPCAAEELLGHLVTPAAGSTPGSKGKRKKKG